MSPFQLRPIRQLHRRFIAIQGPTLYQHLCDCLLTDLRVSFHRRTSCRDPRRRPPPPAPGIPRCGRSDIARSPTIEQTTRTSPCPQDLGTTAGRARTTNAKHPLTADRFRYFADASARGSSAAGSTATWPTRPLTAPGRGRADHPVRLPTAGGAWKLAGASRRQRDLDHIETPLGICVPPDFIRPAAAGRQQCRSGGLRQGGRRKT